jgi:adenine deaminase
VKDLKDFEVQKTYISGQLVSSNGKSLLSSEPTQCPNNFPISSKQVKDFRLVSKHKNIRVIVAEDGQLVTSEKMVPAKSMDGLLVSDVERDILKIAVVNRYHPSPVALSFVQNFGLKEGAIASSVAHDSHNIIVVGVDDQSICRAVNLIIENKGGVAAISKNREELLSLPVAGLMSNEDGYQVANKYIAVDAMAKSLGSQLSAPFMTLSFMALLVIPSLKLSDKGLFNGDLFEFVSPFSD